MAQHDHLDLNPIGRKGGPPSPLVFRSLLCDRRGAMPILHPAMSQKHDPMRSRTSSS